MEIINTSLEGCFVIIPPAFNDSRGYFFESFNEKAFKAEMGQDIRFVQDNQSFSTFGVIRGLHYQKAPHAQAKLVRVLKGEILDVAVDLRILSPTFGKSFSIVLSEENRKQLLVPKGFAHGFSVLSKEASVLYKVDAYYDKESEAGIRYNDETLNIDWGIDTKNILISGKDEVLPAFSDLKQSIK